MTRILFLGDCHGDTIFMDRAIREAKAKGASLIVQVGDWGYLWPGGSGKAMEYVEDALWEAGLPLAFIDGNHDWHTQLPREYMPVGAMTALSRGAYYIARGDSFTWQGIRIVGMGGAPSIDKPRRVEGKSWWPTEVISEADVARASAAGPCDVLVTHDAPELPTMIRPLHGDRDFDWFTPTAAASVAAVKAVAYTLKAQVHIHGHYHEYYEDTSGHDCPSELLLGLAHNGKTHGAMRVIEFGVGEGPGVTWSLL